MFAEDEGIFRLVEIAGRGEPEEEGVYTKLSSPAKESYVYEPFAIPNDEMKLKTYPIPFLLVGVGFRPEFLDAQK